MREIERIEAISSTIQSPIFTAIILFLMIVIGVVFLYLYATGRQTEKDIRKEQRNARKALMWKDCEIEKIKSEMRQLYHEKFAAQTDAKILREELSIVQRLLEWEQYKNAQLLQGVNIDEAERDAFISKRNSGKTESIA